MLQSASRHTARRILTSRSAIHNATSSGAARRFLSTAPASKPRSWKSSALRWGLAAGAIYYYNTSSIFAEETEAAIDRLTTSLDHFQESKLPTVDAIVQERQRQRQLQAEAEAIARAEVEANERDEQKGRAATAMVASPTDHAAQEDQAEAAAEGGEHSLEGLEEEADQQGAFNPETGEINWDCPCLGGMAHGPCGEEFRAAFSCFVYSTDEPKGIECIEKFKGMQDCFRAHPDVYGAELEDEEEEMEEELKAQGLSKEGAEKPAAVSEIKEPSPADSESKSS